MKETQMLSRRTLVLGSLSIPIAVTTVAMPRAHGATTNANQETQSGADLCAFLNRSWLAQEGTVRA
ncbi:hypothetical protein GCM10023350_14870 [Nocardioides endophyticus]|uniref:Uncharacterized protein n=1 Tax=Nocardioides endophyticus TaxID=1353775 RepID=A0ABP8YP59_9ACTN